MTLVTVLVLAAPVGLIALLVFPQALFAIFVFGGTGESRQDLLQLPFRFGYPYLLLYVSILATILHGGVKRLRLRLDHRVLLLLVIFLGLIWASLLYSPNVEYGIDKATRFSTLDMGAFILALAWGSSNIRTLQHTVLAFALMGVGVTLAGVVDQFQVGLTDLTYTRFSFFGANPNIYGRILAFTLMAALVYHRVLVRRLGRTVVFSLLVVGIVVLVGINSRSVLTGFLLALLANSIIGQPKQRIKHTLAVVAAVVILGVIFTSILPEQLTQRHSRVIDFTSDAGINRRVFYISLVPSFGLDVFLHGIGSGGFSQLVSGEGATKLFPHNILVESYAEIGVLGLVVLISFFVIVFSRGWKLAHDSDDRNRLMGKILLLGLVLMIWSALTSGDLVSHRPLWVFAGLILGYTYRLRAEQPARWLRRNRESSSRDSSPTSPTAMITIQRR